MKAFLEKLKKLWHNKWAFGGLAAFLSVILALFLGAYYENLELKSYDLRFAIRGAQETKQDNIVIVTIDDQSITSLKTWPFPRSYFARAILNLHAAGARLIVVDVEFTDPSSAESGRQDLVLAGAIKRAGNVILSGKVVTANDARRNIQNSYVVPPYQLFIETTGARWGIINIDEDPDGFIRRYLLFQTHNQKGYLPVSVHAYLKLKHGSNGVNHVKFDDRGQFAIGDLRIPKVDYQSMLVNYRGPAKTFPSYSFEEVIDDASFKLPGDEDSDTFEIHKMAGTFQDKVVYIGASAEVLQDNKFTPFFSYRGQKRKLPGVEVHANALSTLLRADFIDKQCT